MYALPLSNLLLSNGLCLTRLLGRLLRSLIRPNLGSLSEPCLLRRGCGLCLVVRMLVLLLCEFVRRTVIFEPEFSVHLRFLIHLLILRGDERRQDLHIVL